MPHMIMINIAPALDYTSSVYTLTWRLFSGPNVDIKVKETTRRTIPAALHGEIAFLKRQYWKIEPITPPKSKQFVLIP